MNSSIYRNQEEIKVRAIEIMKESGSEQSNKEYSKKLTDNAYHKLKTYFTMDRMLKDTIHTYEQVLSYSK